MWDLLDGKEQEIMDAWIARIPEEIEINLKKPVLIRVEKKLALNFDPEVRNNCSNDIYSENTF